MNHHNDSDEHWDLIVEPKTSLFDLNLREVWRYRDLMMLFVRRDFVAQYKQTILGPLWHLIQPVLTTLMFLLVFGQIANIPTDGIQPVLFYMSGITLWNYFSACLTSTSNTFVANAGIFGKVYFPRLVIPLSVVMSNLVRLCIQFGLLLAVMGWYAIFESTPFHFGFSWFLLPVLVLLMAGLGLGLGIIISSLTTKYRDFTVLIGFAVQLLMYATPVAYPLSFIKGKNFAPIIEWNPMSTIVEAFRFALFGTGGFELGSLVYPFCFMLAILFLGIMIFTKVERTFMDTV
ncbi:lipopolysaccharide transport system permease protein [Algoriphagus boseongensis]|uniref:Transport permease protein n=1 Tax=Algoriphagus boseongensis TaxID=1442587 RepID=A0A4R6TCE8_9BACT|nr:ABC transporter permease [Algoriphagus boseongensis]TDQ19385.1 lipopolysaccharide transport system permease protein [Algoriphagus boseongensis]